MVFKSTDWEYSDMPTEGEFSQPEAGDQYLLIEKAEYDPTQEVTDIFFQSLLNSAQFRVRYYMKTKDGQKNWYTGKTLHSLGKAINNEDKALAPCDIIGAVVRATVNFTTPKVEGGKSYPVIDEFQPITEDIMEYSQKPEQYYLAE